MGNIPRFVLVIALFSVCSFAEELGKNKLSIAAYSVPAHGHFSPMLTLIKALKEEGHHITFLSSEYIESKVSGKVDAFYSTGIKSEEELITEALGEYKEGIELFDLPIVLKEKERESLSYLIPLFKDLEKQGKLPDIILVDFMSFAGFDIADLFNIPCIVTIPGNFGPGMYTPSWYPSSENGLNLSKRIMGMLMSPMQSVMLYVFYRNSNEVRSEFNIPPWDKFDTSMFTGKITFQFAFPPLLEPGITLAGTYHHLGLPFIPKEDTSLTGDLDNWVKSHKDKKTIYISFGTMVNPTDEFLEFLLHQIRICKDYNFIWSLKDNLIRNNFELFEDANKEEHILILNWVDQISLLDHVDLFITHGGYNSITESVYHAVPMICIPFQMEQMMNCQRIQQLDIGISLDFASREELHPIFKKILSNENSTRNAQMLSEYSKVYSQHGLKSSVEIVELIHQYGEHHLLPLDYKYPFYARFNWDIFLFQIIFSIIFGMLFYKCCCTRKPKSNNKLKKD